MKRLATPLLLLGYLAALTFACYRSAIFRGEQFAYRDAAHFYYPLYERVQNEWRAGHYPPLWEPEENAGMPLLGNPTAAVLYPGKLVFAFVSYPVGLRVYTIAHTLLAFAAIVALMRSWKASWAGATFSGLAYAFGAPILFQYCNIIYLVGAAWAPLGFRAVDRWLRLGKRWGILELAIVLTMETLGGDPETAYLTGVCAGVYALLLAKWKREANTAATNPSHWRGWLIAAGVVLIWVVSTLAIAYWAPSFRAPRIGNNPATALPWMPFVGPMVLVVWGIVGFVLVWKWWRQRELVLVPRLAGLVGAAALAVMLSAVQLLPIAEYTAQTTRAASGGPHDIYPFSLAPVRIVELIWPNVAGSPFHGNSCWLEKVSDTKIWVPSLYFSGLTIVLALGAGRLSGARPERRWLSLIAVASLVLSCGEFISPIYVARHFMLFTEQIGVHDSLIEMTIRNDGQLRDGDGSPYWLLATLLPGFRQFRYPSKMLTFTVLAIAALAAQGFDALIAGEATQRRRTIRWGCLLLGITLITEIGVIIKNSAYEQWLQGLKQISTFGPLDVAQALKETHQGLIHGAIVVGLAIVLALRGYRHHRLAVCVGLLALTVDLAVANASSVLTIPQHFFEANPKMLEVIREAERKDPVGDRGPFRIHRMAVWSPASWVEAASEDRVREFVVWELDTLQPKYGINLGVQYTHTTGVAELYDYDWFFTGYMRRATDDVAKLLGVEPETKVVAYPRRGFDLWTSRYFILPALPNKWVDEHRGFASFLENTERIYPTPDQFKGPEKKTNEMAWLKDEDVQIRRNLSAYPRAWVVHQGRPIKAVQGLGRAERVLPMQEILYSNDLLWRDSDLTLYDPKALAWVESGDVSALANSLSGLPPSVREQAKITSYESERVAIEANLESPGIVVLADVYYPGWELTIDGVSAPLYRVNRMMRGAAVPSGKHRVVFRYRPMSYRAGLVITCVGLPLLGLFGLFFLFRPVTQSIANAEGENPS